MGPNEVVGGTTNVSMTVRIIDDTDGTPEQGVVSDTSGIALWYARQGATNTAIIEATLTGLVAAHADGGIRHIDDGEYRLDLPDAAIATGVDWVQVGGGITGMIVIGPIMRIIDAPALSSQADTIIADTTLIGTPAGSTIAADIIVLKTNADTIIADTTLIGTPAGSTVAADVIVLKTDANTIIADTTALSADIAALPTAVENRQEMDSKSTQLSVIVADTTVIGTPAGSTVAADIAVLKTDANTIIADVTGIAGAAMRGTDGANTTVPDAAGTAPTAVENRQEMDSNSTQLSVIVADTTVIGTPAGSTVAADIIVLKTNADTIIADTTLIGTPAGSTVAADIVVLKTDANTIIADTTGVAGAAIPSVASIAAAVWDKTRSSHTTAGTFGHAFAGLVGGVAEAGTLSTTEMTTDLSEATDDHYIGRTITWITGALAGQSSDITDYTGVGGKLKYTAVTEAPSAADEFILY